MIDEGKMVEALAIGELFAHCEDGAMDEARRVVGGRRTKTTKPRSTEAERGPGGHRGIRTPDPLRVMQVL